MSLIYRKDYPALDYILWDTKADSLTEKTAFEAYEKRWKFIAEDKLTTDERNLIQKLIKSIGKGLFLPS